MLVALVRLERAVARAADDDAEIEQTLRDASTSSGRGCPGFG
jgi:hypothetical protein